MQWSLLQRGRLAPKLVAIVLSLPVALRFNVRPAVASELTALAALRRHSWWAAYRSILPESELRGMDDRRTAQRMAAALRSRLQTILVVEGLAGEPLGYAWIGPHRDGVLGHGGEIYELYLHPDAQGRGMGRQLLVAAIWALVEHGLHPVIVWVLAANPARHFYATCGGERVAQGAVTIAGRSLARLAYSWRSSLPVPS